MLEWNVYYENFNAREIQETNIFSHGSFLTDLKKAHKKYKDNREAFEKEVKSSLMYWYWSKCEWEIIISDWPPSDRVPAIKVDVYDQVMLNWNVFMDYLWEHREELR